MEDYQGVIITEGLDDPTQINTFTVYRATISKDGLPIDYEGHIGRWHLYYVRCSKEEIDRLQPHILKGWYAHFWRDSHLLVIFHDQQFELVKDDPTTWSAATQHGKAQGIPENELDFLTGESA